MSDLGITSGFNSVNSSFKTDILDIFQIPKEPTYRLIPVVNKAITGVEKIKQGVKKFHPTLNSRRINDPYRYTELLEYKNYLLKAIEKKRIVEHRMAKGSDKFSGSTLLLDEFVLTRKIQHPELVFSKPGQDSYFDENNFRQWSNDPCCYICEKKKYTAIFFNVDDPSMNKGFVKIKDEEFIAYLKSNLNLTQNDELLKMPIIFGSVTGGFERKQRMIHSSFYSLLCISEVLGIVKDKSNGRAIQKGIVHLLKTTD